MNLLNKLTLKNLKLNKKRTIVTIIGILLSVALITAVTAMFFSANASLIKFETKYKGNYHYSFIDVPDSEIATFEENRNIELISKVKKIGYAYLKESKNEYKPYAHILAFDENAIKELGINLVSGRLPEKENEILIPTHLKTNGRINYKVGDTITLEVGKRVSDGLELNQSNPYTKEEKEEIIDTTPKEYKIVGIIERPSSSIENYTAPGFSFITTLRNQDETGKTDLYVRYTKKGLKNNLEVTANLLGVNPEFFKKYYEGIYDEAELDQMNNEMQKAKYECDVNQYLIMLESGILKDNSMQALAMVVLVVIGIIIFTSVFCIKNSFDISITEKTKQYGMLASIGATSKQIKKNVYYEAFFLGLIGIPIGILCGLLAAYILIIISNIFLKDMINGVALIFSFSVYPILFAIVLGFLTLYLSAWKSAHRAAKISPIGAIRNSEDIKIKANKIKSPKYVKKIFGIGGDVSYKNLKRNKKKYRTTVISIIVCVSVFIALSYFISLAFVEVQKEFNSTDYNISVNYNSNRNKELGQKVKDVVNFDNVEDYAIVANGYIQQRDYEIKYSEEYLKYFPEKKDKETSSYTTHDENGNEIKSYSMMSIRIYKVGEHAYKEYIEKLGLTYEEAKDKGILINYSKTYVPDEKKKDNYIEKTLSVFGYQKGDTMKWLKEAETEEDINIEIIAVTNEYPFGLKDGLQPMLIVSDSFFEKNFSDDINNEEILIYSNNATKLQDEIDEYLNDYEYSLTNREENVRMMKSFYTLIAIFLYGFITVIALIGVTNIFNTITTNMELRSREFATLKSIGMTKKEFNRMIRLESFFYGTKSLMIGIPIGCLLSYLIYYLLSGNDSSIKYMIPTTAILISVVAVFVLITCIMKYSIGKINKQNTIETIRNENI